MHCRTSVILKILKLNRMFFGLFMNAWIFPITRHLLFRTFDIMNYAFYLRCLMHTIFGLDIFLFSSQFQCSEKPNSTGLIRSKRRRSKRWNLKRNIFRCSNVWLWMNFVNIFKNLTSVYWATENKRSRVSNDEI